MQGPGAPVQVICEATGGWERPVVAALHAAGKSFKVALIATAKKLLNTPLQNPQFIPCS